MLLDEVEGFTELDRRRVFHLAYEHRFRIQTLDALASRAGRKPQEPERPSFQAVFCIDEREESIRRHVEEVAPTAETFGAAGFFGVVMYYRGAAAADFVPLCPVSCGHSTGFPKPLIADCWMKSDAVAAHAAV